MRQILVIAFILSIILILGMWGQYVMAPAEMRSNVLQAAYNTMTLCVLEGDWTATESLPWQLEIARFVAPIFLITGVLIIVTQGAWTRQRTFSFVFARGTSWLPASDTDPGSSSNPVRVRTSW